MPINSKQSRDYRIRLYSGVKKLVGNMTESAVA